VYALAGLAAGAVLLAGCSTLDLTKISLPGMEKTKPAKMIEVWTDTVLHQSGQPTLRGFGGRIMFYGKDEKKSIKVEGRLTVYVFDAAEEDAGSATPERKFIFPVDQLAKHYSQSKLGHSYSFWLPWDEVGGLQRELVLLSRFEATSGEMVMGDAVRQTLPGMLPKSAKNAKAKGGDADVRDFNAARAHSEGVRQVSHEAPLEDAGQSPAAARPAATETMANTVTIDIPVNASVGAGGEPVPLAAAPLIVRTGASDATNRSPQAAAATSDRPANEAAKEASPSTGSAPSRFPARRVPFVPPWRDPNRKQPLPASWQSPPQPTLRSDSSGAGTDTNSNAGPKSN
jgi:hypothetical protein